MTQRSILLSIRRATRVAAKQNARLEASGFGPKKPLILEDSLPPEKSCKVAQNTGNLYDNLCELSFMLYRLC